MGDYDPAYSNNGQYIAWSSFTTGDVQQQTKAEKKSAGALQKSSIDFELKQNYPNPFRSQTNISFRIAEPTHVVLTIYNMAGQKIEMLVDGDYRAGHYSIPWNGKDKNGKMLANGMYLYTLETKNARQTKIMSIK